MNRFPNTFGIDRHWKDGDARVEIRERCGLDPSTVDKVLAALWETLLSRKLTRIIGFGAFEWVPWKCFSKKRGTTIDTWRLSFRLNRYNKETTWNK